MYVVLCIIFFATFSFVVGVLHFTIISRAKKNKRMPYRHETTALHNDIFYLYSLHHLGRCHCVVAQFLHYRLSAVSAQFTQSHTHTHQLLHTADMHEPWAVSHHSMKFSLALHGTPQNGVGLSEVLKEHENINKMNKKKSAVRARVVSYKQW